MRVLALTGGIATGKSTAGRILQELDSGVRIFDCDHAVQELLENGEVLSEISGALGRSVVLSGGGLDRALLRSLVFENPVLRKKLEGVLHPKVRKECLEKLDGYRSNPSTTLFVADVPLLFESGFHFGQEFNLVVATSNATQRIRLKARSHFEDRMITSILQAQLPIMEKVARGDVVFWNEGRPAILGRQLQRFLNSIFTT
ncbi:dephospho-CoA kinase [Verrucomicrobiaceae bacterium 227]